MNENLIKQNETLSLMAGQIYYAVVTTPDGQRFRFEIESLVKKLIDERGLETVLEGFKAAYQYGKQQYEKSAASDWSPQKQYSKLHEDADQSAIWHAAFHIVYAVCEEALDTIKIEMYREEGEVGALLIDSNQVRWMRKHDEEQKIKQQEEKEHAAYWRGYDKGRAEAFAEVEERRKKKKGFWWQ